MITEQKINDIRWSLKKGEPEGEIKERLRQEGYSKEDIDKVFAPRPYDMRRWYMAFAVFLLAVGLITLFNGGGVLPLALSALLFIQYFREIERLKREKARIASPTASANSSPDLPSQP